MAGEVARDPCEDCQEVCFECANGSLRYIPSVHVGRDKLEIFSPLILHRLPVFFAALIVQDLEVHEELSVFEALHDDILDFQTAGVLP